MTDDRDPPLFDALRALSGLTARHQLREDPAMSEHHLPSGWTWTPPPGTDPGGDYGRRYGADDLPGGPPEPPLGHEPGPAPAEHEFKLVPCPCCGTGVTPDRLDR